jgi:hypothetical protein
MARKLVIDIVGNTRDFQRALGDASKQTHSFGGRLASLGPKLRHVVCYAAPGVGARRMAVLLRELADLLEQNGAAP